MSDPVLTVIPCLDEIDHLPVLVEQLLRDPSNKRIIVADGGSTDGSRAWVEARARVEPRVVLLDNHRRIQSAGVNEAVRAFGYAKGWIARIDAHARYPDNFVSCLLDSAQRHGAQSVVVPMGTVGAPGFQRAVAAAQNSRLGTGGSPHRAGGEGGWVDHGHHALMRVEPFRAVGGYRESMATNEDAELDVRLRRHGARIWLEPGCAIDYFPRRTVGALARQYYRYGQGRAVTTRLHRLGLKMRQRIPLLIVPTVILAIAGLAMTPIDPRVAVLAVPAGAWASGCVAAGLFMAFKSQRIDVALAGVALATMHLSWSAGYWSEALTRRGRRRVQGEIDALGTERYSSSVAIPVE